MKSVSTRLHFRTACPPVPATRCLAPYPGGAVAGGIIRVGEGGVLQEAVGRIVDVGGREVRGHAIAHLVIREELGGEGGMGRVREAVQGIVGEGVGAGEIGEGEPIADLVVGRCERRHLEPVPSVPGTVTHFTLELRPHQKMRGQKFTMLCPNFHECFGGD